MFSGSWSKVPLMTMSYTFTHSIWPSFFIVLLMSILAVYSGRRRSVPGATPFMIACLFAAAWEVISLMKVAAIDMSSKIFWFMVQAVDQLPIVISITCFILAVPALAAAPLSF